MKVNRLSTALSLALAMRWSVIKFSVGAQTFPKLQLLRLHGILMIVAWPLLALCGIFFASWMSPALPNGEWFQVHICVYENECYNKECTNIIFYCDRAWMKLSCQRSIINFTIGSPCIPTGFNVRWSGWICSGLHC